MITTEHSVHYGTSCLTKARSSFVSEQNRGFRFVWDSEATTVRRSTEVTKQNRIEDRRIQRTRSLLQGALVSLMVEKPYESITVQEIIDKANVGRATFYAHFADKKSLLASRLEDLRAALVRRQREALSAKNGRRSFSFSRAMLEHAGENLILWRGIADRESGSFVMSRIQEMLADLVRNDLVALGFTRGNADREATVQYLSGAFVALMMWWLNDRDRLTVEEVDDRFTTLALRSIGATAPANRKTQ